MKSCVVKILDMDNLDDSFGADHEPTLLLLALRGMPERDKLLDVVVKSLAIGCEWFASWGSNASVIEDEIDEILEERGSDAVTTSHLEESIDEVIEFLLSSALPGAPSIRLCIASNVEVLVKEDILEKAGVIVRRMCEK